MLSGTMSKSIPVYKTDINTITYPLTSSGNEMLHINEFFG